jgi:hypothetical protein
MLRSNMRMLNIKRDINGDGVVQCVHSGKNVMR